MGSCTVYMGTYVDMHVYDVDSSRLSLYARILEVDKYIKSIRLQG